MAIYKNGNALNATWEIGVAGFGTGTWRFMASNCWCAKASNWSQWVVINGKSCDPPPCPLPKLNLCDTSIPSCQ